MRILVIEDDRQIAEITREFLKEESYAVDVAFSGEEWEKLIDGIPYDLIVPDIVLPGEDEDSIIQTVRGAGYRLKGSSDSRPK